MLSIVFQRELEKKFAEAGVAHTADNSRSDINVVVFIVISLSLTLAFGFPETGSNQTEPSA